MLRDKREIAQLRHAWCRLKGVGRGWNTSPRLTLIDRSAPPKKGKTNAAATVPKPKATVAAKVSSAGVSANGSDGRPKIDGGAPSHDNALNKCCNGEFVYLPSARLMKSTSGIICVKSATNRNECEITCASTINPLRAGTS